MQFAVEIERLRLALGIANAIPKPADLLHPQGSRLDVARVATNQS